MSLSFVQKLSKIKKRSNQDSPTSKAHHQEIKMVAPPSKEKINDFQQHHSDLKSMLQMLECEKSNATLFTPVR